MKHSIFMMIAGIALCCVCMLQLYYIKEKPLAIRQNAVPKTSDDRESITFILGNDSDVGNPYYAEATKFYTDNVEGRTHYLVTTCRSLLEVRDYLQTYHPCNGKPWGLINLVSHGNQWVGLSVRVLPNSRRTTLQRLLEYVGDGSFPPLPDKVVDEDSDIFLHGCGLGNNTQLLEALALAFGGRDSRPLVRASKYFEYYSSSLLSEDLTKSQRYLAEAWLTHHKYGAVPSKDVLSIEFRDKYPSADVNWVEALSRRRPRFVGDDYHYTFEVPVKVVLPIGSDILEGLNEEEEWKVIFAQPRLREMIAEIGIPTESFSWTRQKVYVENEKGGRSAGLLVKGYCTMVTVVRALASPNDGRPFQPLFTDANYYSATCMRRN